VIEKVDGFCPLALAAGLGVSQSPDTSNDLACAKNKLWHGKTLRLKKTKETSPFRAERINKTSNKRDIHV
jgi:hypothetical protein